MGQLLNQSQNAKRRQDLRKSSPPAEVILWQHLRNRQLGGYKFRRQYGIAHYIADFCCPECQLIVELDGSSHEHDNVVEYDLLRQRYFESIGFLVIRFRNEQVYRQLTEVLENLLHYCEERKTK
jgi:very-short-patch-repair endonuclease